MSDETPGATQGALPPREGQQASRVVAERPAVRLTQVAGTQYVLTTSQPHGVPALAQVRFWRQFFLLLIGANLVKFIKNLVFSYFLF